jgi:signal transduction histidine kinase
MDEQKMQIQVAIPDDLPPVKADADALREVFSNLIDNALKYTPAGGTIWVSLERSPATHSSQQQVQISDTGPGIPTEDLERIFERSYRGVQAHTNIPGTGLGLAIARDLVVQMQGELKAFSPALRPMPESTPGSTFQVTLPEYDA